MDQGDFVFHEGVQDNLTNEEIIGPRYYTKSLVTSGTVKVYNYSEESFFKLKDSDIDPLIYIRLNKAVVSSELLPEIDISHFYTQNTTDIYGVDIDVKPDFKTDISKQLISFGQNLFDQKTRLLQPFTPDVIALLKEYLNTISFTDPNSLEEGFKKLKT